MKKVFLPLLLSSIVFVFFLVFFYKIITIENLTFNGILLLLSMNLLFLLKGLESVFYKDHIFSGKKFNMKNAVVFLVPTLFLAGFFIFLFFINPALGIATLNHATKENVAIALPLLLFALLFFSILKSPFHFKEVDPELLLDSLFRFRRDKQYRAFIHQLNNHIRISMFLLFFFTLIFTYFSLDLIYIICFDAGILIFFNFSLYRYRNSLSSIIMRYKEKEKKHNISLNGIKNRIAQGAFKKKGGIKTRISSISKKQRKGGEETEKKRVIGRSVSITAFLITILFTVLIIIYTFDIFSVRSSSVRLFELMFTDNLILALLIINLLLFLVMPFLKLIVHIIIKIATHVKNNVIKGYFYRIFFSALMVIILKIVVFNIELIQLDQSIEWILSTIISLIIFYLSTKLRFTKSITPMVM